MSWESISRCHPETTRVKGMSERPILMNGAMVRATLAGRKTQTRRVIKSIPWRAGCNPGFSQARPFSNAGEFRIAGSQEMTTGFRCPFGRRGDRLWVRETWAQPTTLDPGPTVYRADYPACVPDGLENVPPADAVRWRPSIHMPRWACRLLLEITEVRVERLQAISAADAAAEGLTQTDVGSWLPGPCDHPEWAFHQLWDQINGESAWESNPWVWAITFRRIDA